MQHHRPANDPPATKEPQAVTTTPRPCRITGCPRLAAPTKTICYGHRARIRLYGTPHFSQWHTADEHDVAELIRNPCPTRDITRLERRLIGQGLHGRLPAAEIARLLGVTERTVYRWHAAA
jgi:hypothetical protein